MTMYITHYWHRSNYNIIVYVAVTGRKRTLFHNIQMDFFYINGNLGAYFVSQSSFIMYRYTRAELCAIYGSDLTNYCERRTWLRPPKIFVRWIEVAA